MIWLHQVENAGYEEVANNDSQEEVNAENSEVRPSLIMGIKIV